jgi:hypothetical protein
MYKFTSASDIIKQGVQEAVHTAIKEKELETKIQETMRDDVIRHIIDELKKLVCKYSTQTDKWYIDILFDKETLRISLHSTHNEYILCRHAVCRGYNTQYELDRFQQLSTERELYKKLLVIHNPDILITILRELGYSVTPFKVYKTFLWIPYSLVSDHRIAIQNK